MVIKNRSLINIIIVYEKRVRIERVHMCIVHYHSITYSVSPRLGLIKCFDCECRRDICFYCFTHYGKIGVLSVSCCNGKNKKLIMVETATNTRITHGTGSLYF